MAAEAETGDEDDDHCDAQRWFTHSVDSRYTDILLLLFTCITNREITVFCRKNTPNDYYKILKQGG